MLFLLMALALQAEDSEAAKVLDRINAHRKNAGLEAVAQEAWLSKGCAAHAQYLVRNVGHPSTKGLGLHQEDPKLPGYTADGERAGKASVIFLGLEGPEAVEGWMASLFHRIPLLEARLRKVGYGAARGGPARVTVVLDATNGLAPHRATGPVVYPAEGQKDVPLNFFPEIPDPIAEDLDRKAGFPVTVSFPEGALVKDAKATLKDASGKEIEGWFSSPEKPASADYQRNTIGLIPKDPLQPSTTYTVTVSARITGKAWSRTWSFTSAGR